MAGTIRVLYVDDEPGLLEIGKIFLEAGGEFEVDTLTSARAALEQLKNGRYDAIISDYMMPGIDGITFLKQFKASGNTTPFIIFTGRGREEIVIEALNEGAAFYLQKGGQPHAMFAELEHKIISAVTSRRSEDALRKSEEKFRYLVENALESVLILDFDGKILFANNAAIKLAEVGDSPGLLNRNVMDFIAPESREDVIRDFTRVSRGHDALPAHYQVITANGKKITIECIGQRVTYEGRPADLLSIRDITESRQHEEVVRQKNLMLATLNDLQREFAELPAGMRVEELAVKKLSSLSGAIVTMFSTYDPVDQMLTVSSMEYAPGILESLPGAMEMLTRWLGTRPEDMRMPLSHETYRDINRSIVGIKKTVAEMSYGCISPIIGASIQKLSGIDHFIHIAHVIDGELYGISVMGLKPGQPDPSWELLESFAHMVAVSLRRQRAEAGLVESEERLRSFVGQALEGVSIVDHDGRIIEWNPAQEKITGIPRADTIGVCAWELATRMIPDPNCRGEIRSRMEDSIKSTIKSGISTHPDPIFYTFHRPDGTTAIAKQTVFVIKTSRGHLIGTLNQDVTSEKRADEKIKESEEKFRSLVEYSLDAILVLDLQGTILLANKAAATLVEAGEGTILAGRNVMEFIAPESREDVMKDFMQVAKGHDAYLAHYTAISEKGKKITVESIGKVINYEGRPADLVSLRDITERMRAEEALRQANRKLNLLSGITRHDLKNQLLTLNGFLEISKKYPGDAAKMSEFIAKERKVVKTMERQIAFTKEYEAIGVNAPVWQDCCTLIETAAKQVLKGTITVKNDMPAGSQVFADPLIVKVCYNLMDNAVRHGGKITTIRFAAEERGDNRVVVCEDDGAGILAEEKEQVFERGFGKNTGMGLFLSAEILSITGITIRETGEPGKGARFEITVPKGAWRIIADGE